MDISPGDRSAIRWIVIVVECLRFGALKFAQGGQCRKRRIGLQQPDRYAGAHRERLSFARWFCSYTKRQETDGNISSHVCRNTGERRAIRHYLHEHTFRVQIGASTFVTDEFVCGVVNVGYLHINRINGELKAIDCVLMLIVAFEMVPMSLHGMTVMPTTSGEGVRQHQDGGQRCCCKKRHGHHQREKRATPQRSLSMIRGPSIPFAVTLSHRPRNRRGSDDAIVFAIGHGETLSTSKRDLSSCRLARFARWCRSTRRGAGIQAVFRQVLQMAALTPHVARSSLIEFRVTSF